MATGSIFTLMINDGKADMLLTATSKLLLRIEEIYDTRVQQCMQDMQIYFTSPMNQNKPRFVADLAKWTADPMEFCINKTQAVHTTMLEIAKTHKNFIGQCYKPFVAMAFSYLKINEKAGQQTFGNDITFTVPQIGTWISDMVLHIKLTGLKAVNPVDKVKYAAFLGHRLLEKVTFLVNNIPISEYTSETYNKHYQFHVPSNKKVGWQRNVGQEVPNLAYMTPDPSVDEFREYRLFGDGPQTFKYVQPDIDMYIPLLFWFNLSVSQAFPNVKIPKGFVTVQIKFATLDKLVASADNGGGGAYVAPQIITADLYVDHINTLPEIENIMLQDYDFSLIRINKTFEKILTHSTDSILLKELKFPVEHMAIIFRPVINSLDIDNWHRGTVLKPVNLYVPAAVLDNTVTPPQPTLAINTATYYTESPTIDNCGLTINDIDIFQKDTVAKYSSFYPYAAVGLNTPDDQGWLMMNNQFRPDIYDPSGHIDMSRNREVYLNYDSSYINGSNLAKLTVVAQTINFLIIDKNSAHLKYI